MPSGFYAAYYDNSHSRHYSSLSSQLYHYSLNLDIVNWAGIAAIAFILLTWWRSGAAKNSLGKKITPAAGGRCPPYLQL
ncbi:MAG: hypothetical protein AB4352_04930 [Hormoscilla sp.]